MIFGNGMDFEMTTQFICWDLANAYVLEYLPKIKQRYNIAFLPLIHRLYSGTLKVAGYKWLNKKTKLFVFVQWWDDDKITMFDDDIDFMGNKYLRDTEFVDENSKLCGVKIEKMLDWFDFLEVELPVFRIIKEVKYIHFFRIGKNFKKNKNIIKLLWHFSRFGNVIFLSNLHENLPYDNCLQEDNNLFDWEWKKHFMLDLFFDLSDFLWHKPRLIWYENTSMIDWNTSKTTWYCSIVC